MHIREWHTRVVDYTNPKKHSWWPHSTLSLHSLIFTRQPLKSKEAKRSPFRFVVIADPLCSAGLLFIFNLAREVAWASHSTPLTLSHSTAHSLCLSPFSRLFLFLPFSVICSWRTAKVSSTQQFCWMRVSRNCLPLSTIIIFSVSTEWTRNAKPETLQATQETCGMNILVCWYKNVCVPRRHNWGRTPSEREYTERSVGESRRHSARNENLFNKLRAAADARISLSLFQGIFAKPKLYWQTVNVLWANEQEIYALPSWLPRIANAERGG